MIKPKWIVLHECDLYDGTPTCWALKVAENKHYFIDAMSDGTYNVTLDDCITVAKTCSSLTSAKLWVTAHLL